VEEIVLVLYEEKVYKHPFLFRPFNNLKEWPRLVDNHALKKTLHSFNDHQTKEMNTREISNLSRHW
jgi:hypothetical protein